MIKKSFTFITYFALITFICGCSSQPTVRSRVSPDVAINIVDDHIKSVGSDLVDEWTTARVNITSTIPVFETDDIIPDYYLYLLDCKGTFCGEVLVNIRNKPPSVVQSSWGEDDIWTPKIKNRRAYYLGWDWFFVEENGAPSSKVITLLSPEGITKSDFVQILANHRTILRHQFRLKKDIPLFHLFHF